ncbi:YnjH family protein [Photobacterium makurazakiensis]|uniref:DUF1496 domain-containing protein n=1 Tax=Photobacterium makurazakiensis TaxID=2910234 RepID=UPI003D10A0F2
MNKVTRKVWGGLGLVFMLCFSSNLYAKSISVSHEPTLTLEGALTNQRVCYFDGKSYSLGAVIVVEGVMLECKPENSFETNGKLKWHRVKA